MSKQESMATAYLTHMIGKGPWPERPVALQAKIAWCLREGHNKRDFAHRMSIALGKCTPPYDISSACLNRLFTLDNRAKKGGYVYTPVAALARSMEVVFGLPSMALGDSLRTPPIERACKPKKEEILQTPVETETGFPVGGLPPVKSPATGEIRVEGETMDDDAVAATQAITLKLEEFFYLPMDLLGKQGTALIAAAPEFWQKLLRDNKVPSLVVFNSARTSCRVKVLVPMSQCNLGGWGASMLFKQVGHPEPIMGEDAVTAHMHQMAQYLQECTTRAKEAVVAEAKIHEPLAKFRGFIREMSAADRNFRALVSLFEDLIPEAASLPSKTKRKLATIQEEFVQTRKDFTDLLARINAEK